MMVFKKILYKNSLKNCLLLLFILITIIFILVEIRNGRYWQSDFEVYYKSALRALHGENLYRPDEDQFYRYKYSPAAAYLFIPFLLFSFAKAKFIYSFFLTFMMYICHILCIKFCYNDLQKMKDLNYKRSILVFMALILPILAFYIRELHLGQVNIILLLLYLLSFYFYRRNLFISALILTLSGFIKPYFIIFIMYFIYEKQFKYVFYIMLSSIIFFFIPFFTYNLSMSIEQNMLWINELKLEILLENNIKDGRAISIFSLFSKYISFDIFRHKILSHLIILLTCCVFIISFLRKTAKFLPRDEKLFYDLSLFCVFIPLLISNGLNTYVIILPALYIILKNLNKKYHIKIVIFIISCVFIGFNFTDGGVFTSWIKKLLLLPLGAILLLGVLYSSINKIKDNDEYVYEKKMNDL
ncbi:glycosyltransferase family 87 protein [Silvanigrella aquatica]|uniref:Glycosyltransferase RgtA/B/C/D-like domain-containing protein n=1 Tax=Silvanigrella aquatica TaxID=1915309 RepID=A0A1L4CZ40_9BACT|nr:glycosyltransferase family 87 protein [Silvanigrella aquatica]APJ03219.1 hypothetical protein AXG55_04595 [Silvanigrella aquatica]